MSLRERRKARNIIGEVSKNSYASQSALVRSIMEQDTLFQEMLAEAVNTIVSEIVANKPEINIPEYPEPIPTDTSVIEARLEKVMEMLSQEPSLDLSEVLEAVKNIQMPDIPAPQAVDLEPLVSSLERLEEKLEQVNTLPKEYLVDRDYDGKIRVEVIV